MIFRFRLQQLDTHAHVGVWFNRRSQVTQQDEWIRSGELSFRAEEYGAFRSIVEQMVAAGTALPIEDCASPAKAR